MTATGRPARDTDGHDVPSPRTSTCPSGSIAAPAAGVFRSPPPEVVTSEGEIVQAGQVIGIDRGHRRGRAVTSPHTGFLMGLLALPGERVRAASRWPGCGSSRDGAPAADRRPGPCGRSRVAGWGTALPADRRSPTTT